MVTGTGYRGCPLQDRGMIAPIPDIFRIYSYTGYIRPIDILIAVVYKQFLVVALRL